MALFNSIPVNVKSEDELMQESYNITYEFTNDIYKTISATYISDILIEQSIDNGTYDDAILTSVLEQGTNKVLEFLRQLREKLKIWFRNAIATLYSNLSKGDKIKEELKSATKDFKGDLIYKYETTKADIYLTHFDKDFTHNGDFDKKFSNVINIIQKSLGVIKSDDTGEKITIENLKENIEKEDFVKYLNKTKSNDKSKEEIIDIEETDIKTLIDILGTFKSRIENFKTDEKTIMNNIKTAEDDLKRQVITMDNGKHTKKVTLYTFALNYLQRMYALKLSMIIREYKLVVGMAKEIISKKIGLYAIKSGDGYVDEEHVDDLIKNKDYRQLKYYMAEMISTAPWSQTIPELILYYKKNCQDIFEEYKEYTTEPKNYTLDVEGVERAKFYLCENFCEKRIKSVLELARKIKPAPVYKLR